MSDSPTTIPHSWLQFAYLAITALIASAGTCLATWIKNRRRPIDDAKTRAEVRSIDTASDLSVIAEMRETLHEAAMATGRAEQLREQRDHWQRKCESLEKQNDLLNIEVNTQDQQMRRMSGFIRAKGLHLSDLD